MAPRGVFRGLRFKFLEEEREGYANAITNNAKDDFIKDVLRQFFKRFPPELPLDKEPSETHLQAVDDSKPDSEPEAPNADKMTPEQYQDALKLFQDRKELIETRSGVSTFIWQCAQRMFNVTRLGRVTFAYLCLAYYCHQADLSVFSSKSRHGSTIVSAGIVVPARKLIPTTL